MLTLLVNWLLNAVSLIIVAHVIRGFDVTSFRNGVDSCASHRVDKRNSGAVSEDRDIATDTGDTRDFLVRRQSAHVEVGVGPGTWLHD